MTFLNTAFKDNYSDEHFVFLFIYEPYYFTVVYILVVVAVMQRCVCVYVMLTIFPLGGMMI